MIQSSIIRYSKNTVLSIFWEIVLLFSLHSTSFAMYEGSPHWHPPKKAICMGISDFPNGMEIRPYAEQVYGSSLDSYVFSQMNGALGIYYFQLELQEPPDSNELKGTVTYLDSIYWKPTEFKVTCTVKEWH